MSRCDCSDCEAYRDKERAYYRQQQEKIRKGLARIGYAVALWGAMASASKAAIAYAAGASEASRACGTPPAKTRVTLMRIWRNAQPPWSKRKSNDRE